MLGEKLMLLLRNYAGTRRLAPIAVGVSKSVTYNMECGGGVWPTNCDNDCNCNCSDCDCETEGYTTSGADD
ncbi:MAG: hypothetical protein E7311_02125 [Clostridiales bacterium]|nr:hypothetical protein [Clostridiales bacterium]